MTTTVEDLADYVGAAPTEPLLPLVHASSLKMIDDYLGPRGKAKCPTSVYDLATLELGSNLWVRRNSPGGITSWASGDVPVRLARDAMLSVAPMLARYRGLGAVG
jgi:hypothetical protein